ncbi:hypothetical protein PNOK_0849500 [Pyrrhoderma noxium]|uniref:Sugar phosphate phosphatase n=1 Tax=Pyrrhoderma noxium TaxID=2282107 RepID=A0A286U7R5_9AGAM|nr:hypothetical protein PNOK_0849500 [Pyrrhoderma noxium]
MLTVPKPYPQCYTLRGDTGLSHVIWHHLDKWVLVSETNYQVHRDNYDLIMSNNGQENPEPEWRARVEEGKAIIEKVSKLKYEMARDRLLQPIPSDGEANVEVYNIALNHLLENDKNTWFTAPWLYAECYLYRLLRSWFGETKHWKYYDPFFSGKEESFKASSVAIYKLASMMHELEETKDELCVDHDKLAVLFNEMVQMCLWGNATDLSLLTNLTHEDILRLQNVGKDAHEERKEFILRDDEKVAFSHLAKLHEARIDFVLDNAGFELFTDLVLADFLVSYTPFVSKVVFHPKSIPWFVSDVVPPDFGALFEALLSPTFFSENAPTDISQGHLKTLVNRWKYLVENGVFSLSVPHDSKIGEKNEMYDFWTSPFPYWEMENRAPKLFESLRQSGLVIFKGDLNYRKLTGDVYWPASTPFEHGIGPLAGSFPILSLRTSKADVVVGVDQTKADALDASGEKWRVNGKYAMISFVPRCLLCSSLDIKN